MGLKDAPSDKATAGDQRVAGEFMLYGGLLNATTNGTCKTLIRKLKAGYARSVMPFVTSRALYRWHIFIVYDNHHSLCAEKNYKGIYLLLRICN